MSVVEDLDRLIEDVPEGAVLVGLQLGAARLVELRHELRLSEPLVVTSAAELKREGPFSYRGVPLEIFDGAAEADRLAPVYVPDCAHTGTDKEWRA